MNKQNAKMGNWFGQKIIAIPYATARRVPVDMDVLLSFVLTFFTIHQSYCKNLCLGIPGACDATLKDITLPGTHNAGAGFDGILRYHTALFSFPASSCWYRNQGLSIYDQLKLGVRYFDIDTCYEGRSRYRPNGAWTCHNSARGGAVAKMLDQVNKWVNEPQNRREIVVLHFNRDYNKKDRYKIGQSLTTLLKERWEPTQKRKQNKDVTLTDDLSQRLGTGIEQNKRIYVFINEGLMVEKQPYFFSHRWVAYTWKQMTWAESNRCKKLANEIANDCGRASSYNALVRLDLTLSSGLCVGDMAKECNGLVDSTSKQCYKTIRHFRQSNSGTVNFIVIDYIENKQGRRAISVAKELTKVHLARII